MIIVALGAATLPPDRQAPRRSTVASLRDPVAYDRVHQRGPNEHVALVLKALLLQLQERAAEPVYLRADGIAKWRCAGRKSDFVGAVLSAALGLSDR